MQIRRLGGLACATIGTLASNIALAGVAIPGVGVLAHAPVQLNSIPTLSGWTLVILGLLFAIIAFRVMRSRNVSGRVASLVSSGILALSALAGSQLVSDSEAAAPMVIDLTVASGGNVVIAEIGTFEYRNISGVPQEITSITLNRGFSTKDPAPDTPECRVNLVLRNNSSCFLSVIVDSPAPT